MSLTNTPAPARQEAVLSDQNAKLQLNRDTPNLTLRPDPNRSNMGQIHREDASAAMPALENRTGRSKKQIGGLPIARSLDQPLMSKGGGRHAVQLSAMETLHRNHLLASQSPIDYSFRLAARRTSARLTATISNGQSRTCGRCGRPAPPWEAPLYMGEALQVATVAMQLIRRSTLDAFDRQQHDKLVQDFAALHERPHAAPQASEAQCSCPSRDGSLRWPCAKHRTLFKNDS